MCTAFCMNLNSWESNKTKLGRDRWPSNIEGYMHLQWKRRLAAVAKQDGNQFSTASVKLNTANNWLSTLFFFCILTFCILLSMLVKLWNINLNFWVRISEYLFTKICILLDLLQLGCFMVQRQRSGRFMGHPVVWWCWRFSRCVVVVAVLQYLTIDWTMM